LLDSSGLFLSLCCSVKPPVECPNPESKRLAGLDPDVDEGLSLSMVCDEEVVSAESPNKHSLIIPPSPKQDVENKTKARDMGRTGIRKVRTVYLSRFELEGLKAVVDWLEGLPVGKRSVPKDLPDPDVLLKDVKVSRISLDNNDVGKSAAICKLHLSPVIRFITVNYFVH